LKSFNIEKSFSACYKNIDVKEKASCCVETATGF